MRGGGECGVAELSRFVAVWGSNWGRGWLVIRLRLYGCIRDTFSPPFHTSCQYYQDSQDYRLAFRLKISKSSFVSMSFMYKIEDREDSSIAKSVILLDLQVLSPESDLTCYLPASKELLKFAVSIGLCLSSERHTTPPTSDCFQAVSEFLKFGKMSYSQSWRDVYSTYDLQVA